MNKTKRRMSASLPRTPCTPELRDRMVTYAAKEGRSLTDIQRDAIALFLSKNDTQSVVNDTLSIQEQPA